LDEERLKVIYQLVGQAPSNVKARNDDQVLNDESETDQFPLSDSDMEAGESFFNRNNRYLEPNAGYYCRLHFVSNSFYKLEVGKLKASLRVFFCSVKLTVWSN
jgi:hypothetical protein